jgi:hypothetical protein
MRKDPQTDVSDAEIEQAIRSVARLIDRYGDAYWPVLDRLEAELRERNNRKQRLRAHLPFNKKAHGKPETHSG